MFQCHTTNRNNKNRVTIKLKRASSIHFTCFCIAPLTEEKCLNKRNYITDIVGVQTMQETQKTNMLRLWLKLGNRLPWLFNNAHAPKFKLIFFSIFFIECSRKALGNIIKLIKKYGSIKTLNLF